MKLNYERSTFKKKKRKGALWYTKNVPYGKNR